MGGPCGAAQFCLAGATRRQVFKRERAFAHHRVHGRHFLVLGFDPGQERAAEDEQRQNRESRKQEPLEPFRLGKPQAGETADDQSRQPKEENIEAAGRGHFDAEEHETGQHPIPPDHGGTSFGVVCRSEGSKMMAKV